MGDMGQNNQDQVRDILRNARRVAVIGNGGSGKSTLALQLHAVLGLPLYHLDKYFWKPEWTHPDLAEYKMVHDALCDKEWWIIEGLNMRVIEHRFQRADVIIFLDTPAYICFLRILKRTLTYYGKEAPASAEGCKEAFNWKFLKFLKWVLWDFAAKKPALIQLLDVYRVQKPVFILRSSKEVQTFVNHLA